MAGEDYNEENRLLGSENHSIVGTEDGDLEAQSSSSRGRRSFRDLIKQLDRGFSGRAHSFKRNNGGEREVNVGVDDRLRHDRDENQELHRQNSGNDALGDSAPPEWALLLIGCLLGLATGLCVAAFENGVSFSLQILMVMLII